MDFYYKDNEREQVSMYTFAPKGIVNKLTGRSTQTLARLFQSTVYHKAHTTVATSIFRYNTFMFSVF